MTHKALEAYFDRIIPKIETKETTMFKQSVDNLKAHFLSLWTKPVKFVEEEPTTLMDEDYWAFEMRTGEWVDECGETHPVQHDVVIEPHEGTWMEVLDRILDEMEKHYGYNIKEQVYYSVAFPHNEPCHYTGELPAGYGRSLNDEVLQKLLLSFPEVYEVSPAAEWKQL